MRQFLNYSLIFLMICFFSCGDLSEQKSTTKSIKAPLDKIPTPKLNLEQANRLADLPLHCVDVEYPNKLGQVLGGDEDLGSPKELHPAFYGCFDWHSAVHGHWSIVSLLKQFPNLDKADSLKQKLANNITPTNIEKELAYFDGKYNKNYERTYGWAWLLKLQQELDSWDDPLAKEMAKTLQPLTELISKRYVDYLPKLNYAIRVGEHTNTAFGMSFAWDYAVAAKDTALRTEIKYKALNFYTDDQDCPLSWEPSGYDFLSPCLEELDIMRKVLPEEAFHKWVKKFIPGIEDGVIDLEIGKVSDRKDGKLVHIDGLNLSRAWVIYGLINQYPQYENLREYADAHLSATLPNLVGDSYEGGHWLGSFAIYALNEANHD